MGRGGAEAETVNTRTGGWPLLKDLSYLLYKEKNFLVLGHTSPDADCLGSVAALTRFLNQCGKDAIAFAGGQEPLPERFRFLGTDSFQRELPGDLAERVVVVLDCALRANTGIAEQLSNAKTVVQCDHHTTDNQCYTDLNLLVDTSSAAEIVTDLIRQVAYNYRIRGEGYGGGNDLPYLSELIDGEMATALYAGIVSDTGRFRYSNTSASTLKVAAELIEAGANPGKVADALYQETPFRRMKLSGVALGNAELHHDGRVMVCRISQEDFRRTGLHENDGSRLIDTLRGVEGVQVVVLIQERESRKQAGVHRVMLRSRNGQPDVAEVARHFSGGGHQGASSFVSELPLAELEEKLLPLLG